MQEHAAGRPGAAAGTSADGSRSVVQDGPVLIVGNSRSGTTMLARMLDRHSALHALKELHFAEELWLPTADEVLSREAAVWLADRLLHNAREWYHATYVPGTFAQPAGDLVDDLPMPVQAVDVLRAVLSVEARRAGKRIAVEQTPTNVFYVEQLLDRLPGSLAVVLVRDPRDVLLSQKNWWRRRFRGTSGISWRTTLRQWADYHPVTTSLIWRGGVHAGFAVSQRPDVVSLRFEDLVTDPHTALTAILSPLGLQVEPQMLDVPRISSSNASDRTGSGVDPSVVGGFRDGLSLTELWVSQRLTRAELERFGYPVEPVRSMPLSLVGLLLVLPVKLVLAVLLNRNRSRSLVTSVRRRLLT